MKFNKKNIYITLFGILYGGVALVSLIHAVSFFALANLLWLAILLAVIFEIGQSAVLFSILTSSTGKSKVMPWTLMCILTAVQILGNVFSSYKYIVSNSPENLRFFKEPVFIWTDIPDAQATVIITYIVGGILPLVALAMSAMVTNYLEDEKDKNPLMIDKENQEKIEKVFEEAPEAPMFPNEEDSLLNQHSMLQMENQGLHESIDKKDKELEQLKEELKSKQELIDSQNQKINNLDKENQELVKEKFDEEPKDDKKEEDTQYGLSGTNMGFTPTEKGQKDDRDEDGGTSEDDKPVFQTFSEPEYTPTVGQLKEAIKELEKINNEKDERGEHKLDNAGESPLETTDEQTKETISEDPQPSNEEQVKEEDPRPNELVGEDMNDKSGYLIGEAGDPGVIDENIKVADALMGGNILTKRNKDSHFINKT